MVRDTLLGFPAHTLPYRHGNFITLSTNRRAIRRVFFYFATLPHGPGHAAPKKAHGTAGAPPPSARAPLRSESLIY